MDILKRVLAPLTDDGWKEVDAQAKRTLEGNLSARKLVDFSGPHGWSHAAVNLGRVKVAGDGKGKDVEWGIREVLPLVEVRVPFSLGIWNLDDVSRGAKDPDLDALIDAARKAAIFEETAVYHGFAGGGIRGLLEASANKAVPLGAADEFAASVESGVLSIQKAGIGGPYALVLGTEPYRHYMSGDPSLYPQKRRIDAVVGSVSWSPVVKGGVVLSRRGGDFELTVGQDFAIGYLGHDAQSVSLYLTESFTFRVLEPDAVVEMKAGK